MPKHEFGKDVIDPGGFSDMLNMISAEYERLHAENLSLHFQLAGAGGHQPVKASCARRPKTLITETLHSAVPTTPQENTGPVEKAASYIGNLASVDKNGSNMTSPRVRPRTMFMDPAAMKHEVREILGESDVPRNKQVDLYKTEGIMQAVVRHPWFEGASAWAIMAYTLWLWVDTDLNTADIISKAKSLFFIVDQVFCSLFFLEIVMRFMAYSSCRNCCRDRWFMFDLVLTGTMVAETWIVTIIIAFMGTGGNFIMQEAKSVSVFRLFRLVRLVRLARMARLIRKSAELLILLKAVTAAIRSAAATYILLIACHYVFAIGYCTSLKGYNIHTEYFGTVLKSMQTLYLHCTMMEDITDLVSSFQEEDLYPHLVFLYIFMFLANTTIMSMLMGVIVEVVSSVATAERESVQIVFVRDVLESFRTMGIDADNDGSLDKNEFYCLLKNEEAMGVLKDLGVDIVALVEIAEHIFGEEDDDSMDDQDLRVSFEDFLEMVLQLRGNISATVKDVMGLRRLIKDNFRVLNNLSKNAGIFQERCDALPVSDFAPLLRRTMINIRNSEAVPTQEDSPTVPAQSQRPIDEEEDLKNNSEDAEQDKELSEDIDCKLKL